MALNWEVRNISVAGGVETKTHPKLVESPKTTTADNVIYTTNGAARKRNGYTALPRTEVGSGGLISAGTNLAVSGQELLLNDGTALWSWSPQLQAWSSKGPTGVSSISATSVGPLGGAPGTITSATIGNYVCVAYDSSATPGFLAGGGNMYVGVFDLSKNTWLFPPVAPITTGSAQMPGRPCVVAFGNYFYVFYMIGNTTTPVIAAQYYTVNPALFVSSGLVFTGPTSLVSQTYTPDSTGTTIDAQATPDGTALVAAYSLNAGASVTQAFKFTTPGSAPASNRILTTALGPGPVTLAVNNQKVIFCTPTKVVALDLAGFFTLGATVTLTFNSTYAKFIAPCIDTNNYICLATGAGVQGTDPNTIQSVGYALGSLAGTTITMSAPAAYPWASGPVPIQPLSKPYSVANANYFQIYTTCLGSYSVTLQGTVAIQQLSGSVSAPTTVVARALYDVPTYQAALANSPLTVPTADAKLGILAVQALTTTELGPFASLVRLAATSVGPAPVLPLGQGALVGGARPQIYDGTTLQGSGFDAYPELPPLSGINLGVGNGNLTNGATYFYTAVYLRIDAFGNRVMSSPAPVITVVLGPGGNAIYASGTVNPWPAYAGATLVIYRTTATDTLNFRELRTVSFAWQNPPGGFLGYFDNISDSTLVASSATYPLLYAPPTGELPNDPPPAFQIAAGTQQRVFVVSTENPTRLYYSKPFSVGRSVEFNAQSYLTVDPATGPITALAYLDEKLIIFKAGALYVIAANAGPDATGAGVFTVSRLAVDSGCSVASSIVTTDEGVYFQGSRGIQILTRSLQTQYVGEAVESLIFGRVVQAALYVPGVSQARFYLDNGTAAVYDAFLKRWSTFSNVAAVAAVVFGNAATFLTAGGTVNVENTGFTDNGAAITMTLETGWIPVAAAAGQNGYKTPNLQGWGRLRRVLILGTYKSAHTATLSFAYDWGNYVDNVAFSSAAGLLNGDTVEQWRTRTVRQVMQSVRLKLVDSAISGESYDIVGLALEIATKAGTAKLPQAKSV